MVSALIAVSFVLLVLGPCVVASLVDLDSSVPE
jgi:hypothetical protein